jgi:hydroxyacylglutathione hydrolase
MSEVYRIINNLLYTNSYLFVKDRKCILIDPGSDFDVIKAYINSNELIIVAIIATHGHFDHIASAVKFQIEFNCKLYMHIKDAKTLKLSNFLMKIFGFNSKIDIPVVDFYFEGDEGTIILDEFEVNFYLMPGHTSGSCVLKIENNIFSGDVLLISNENSKIPNENLELLNISQNLIFQKFNDDILLWPGHGKSSYLIELKKYFI